MASTVTAAVNILKGYIKDYIVIRTVTKGYSIGGNRNLLFSIDPPTVSGYSYIYGEVIDSGSANEVIIRNTCANIFSKRPECWLYNQSSATKNLTGTGYCVYKLTL